jgi:D-glycero-alpha-D-manno-heptose-7-phosphate kinase
MKESILMGEIDNIGTILHHGWQSKKKMAVGISSPAIDELYTVAMENGSTGGKISGAGGFFFFYCPLVNPTNLINSLSELGIQHQKYHFTKTGLYTYKL